MGDCVSDAPFIGRKVSRYRLVAEIGCGRLGTVYRAEDESQGRDVAVRLVFGDETQRPAFRERFLQEARKVARLAHPGIVPTYDFGESEELLFSVSEYVRDPSLAGMLGVMKAQGQLVPMSEAIALVGDLATIVACAHSCSVLHLGLRPSRVHVRQQPGAALPFYPLLRDFGLAGQLKLDLTNQTTAAETLDYLAPEQLAGEPGSTRSDVYSLGVILYELLTGSTPFQSTNAVEAFRIRDEGPAIEPQAVRPDVPAEVSAITLRAIARRPAARFRDASELAEAMSRVRYVPPPGPAKTISLGSSFALLTRNERDSDDTAALPAIESAAGAPNEVTIQLPDRSLCAHPGEELILPLIVRNSSNLVDHFSLEVAGIPAAWICSLPETHMFPGDQRELALAIRPPRSPASRAGVMPVEILLTSRAMSRVVSHITVDLIVEPFSQWRLALQPQRMTASAQGRFAVQIVNEGNSDLLLALSASDYENVCRYEFDRKEITTPAGESQEVGLVVSGPFGEAIDADHTYAFTVSAGSVDGQLKQVSGDWIRTPPAFDVLIEPQQQRAPAEATYTVVVSNPARSDPQGADVGEAVTRDGITIDLTAGDAQALLVYRFDPAQLIVLPGDCRRASLRVTTNNVLPEGAQMAHEFIVRATIRDSGLTQQVAATWVQFAPQFALSLESVHDSGSVSGEFLLVAENISDESLELTLAAADKGARCRFAFSTTNLMLQPRSKGVVQVTVSRASNELVSELEEHSFEVTAWPAQTHGAAKRITGSWRQTPPELRLFLGHDAEQTLRQGIYQLTLENMEPVDLAVVLQASDPASALSYRFGSRQLIIPANGRAVTELDVQPQHPLAGMEPLTHTFSVRALMTAAPGVNRVVEGQWVQRLPNFSLTVRAVENTGVARGLFDVEIANDEATELIIDLAAAELGQGSKCAFRLAATQVTAPARQKRKVQLVVERADHSLTDEPRTHAFIVTARAGDAPRLRRQVTEKWQQIAPTFDIRILGQPALERRVGEFLIELRNSTPIELPITLAASDQSRECVFQLSERQVRVAPGQTQQVRLNTRGQRDLLGLQGKTHQFQVEAQLANLPGVRAKASASWVQVPAALSVQLLPERYRGGKKAEFQLIARNECSVPLTMEAAAGDPQGNLRYQFSPPRVSVPPAESRSMKLKTSAIARVPREQATRVHPISVAVTAIEAPMFVERMTCEWEELPRRQYRFGNVLFVVVILLLLAAALLATLYALGFL